tara:strand:- start:877 stop:1638 length:762 start_codon:yes stop_codon:yes gene_type:complete
LREFELKNFKNNLSRNIEHGVLTGYYEPEIKAFTYPKKGSYPIYKNPKEHDNNIDINISRKIINKGYYKNKNLEIAWLESEAEAFFLHIQGSGRLILENNKSIKVRYSGSNKKKYTSLGRLLIKNGIMKKNEVNMYTLKKWIKENKKKARIFMDMNERYIFFEEYIGNTKGGSGINLVPDVSVAIDKRFIKTGEAIIIQNINNNDEVFLGIAHDEGAAIKGNRVDLFTGTGFKAEKRAAMLNEKVNIWKLKQK